MRKVLVTGFEPFGGERANPSYDAARLLRDVIAVELPCTFADAPAALREAIERHEPELVIATGQAGGRTGLSLEKVAINLIDARIPDNAGAQPSGEPVVPGGPAAYFTRLPVKAMVQAARAAGLPAVVSYTAGTFVCNQVAYVLAHLIETEYPALRGGFAHVPYAPHQVTDGGQPSMDTATVARALEVVIATALLGDQDVPLIAGTIQ